jgi:hypothetical protein
VTGHFHLLPEDLHSGNAPAKLLLPGTAIDGPLHDRSDDLPFQRCAKRFAGHCLDHPLLLC